MEALSFRKKFRSHLSGFTFCNVKIICSYQRYFQCGEMVTRHHSIATLSPVRGPVTLRVIKMIVTVRKQGKRTAFYTPGRDGASHAFVALS